MNEWNWRGNKAFLIDWKNLKKIFTDFLFIYGFVAVLTVVIHSLAYSHVFCHLLIYSFTCLLIHKCFLSEPKVSAQASRIQRNQKQLPFSELLKLAPMYTLYGSPLNHFLETRYNYIYFLNEENETKPEYKLEYHWFKNPIQFTKLLCLPDYILRDKLKRSVNDQDSITSWRVRILVLALTNQAYDFADTLSIGDLCINPL